MNCSNSLKYQLPGPLFWLSSNQRVQVTQIPQNTSYQGSFLFLFILWITQIPWNTNYQGPCFDYSPTNVFKLPKFPKIPVTRVLLFSSSFFSLRGGDYSNSQKYQLPEPLIWHFSILFCPSYLEYPNYQLPTGPFFNLVFFCKLLKFPKILITRASVLTFR